MHKYHKRHIKVEKQIQKLYEKVFNRIYTKYTKRKLYEGKVEELEDKIRNFENSKAYDEFAKKFSKELAKQGLKGYVGTWRKYYEAAKRLHHIGLPNTFNEYQNQIYRKTIAHNFKFIKSIPSEVFKAYEKKYVKTLMETASGKKGRKAFENELSKSGAVNAKLIARTETAKMQTEIERVAATDLGSVAYIWSSTNDKRTRQSHKDMNKVVVFWRNNDLEKPLLDKMYGDAGEFPNCRCDTYPIYDERDLKDSTYKVYDYRKHEIIRLTRNKLIKALKQGNLDNIN